MRPRQPRLPLSRGTRPSKTTVAQIHPQIWKALSHTRGVACRALDSQRAFAHVAPAPAVRGTSGTARPRQPAHQARTCRDSRSGTAASSCHRVLGITDDSDLVDSSLAGHDGIEPGCSPQVVECVECRKGAQELLAQHLVPQTDVPVRRSAGDTPPAPWCPSKRALAFGRHAAAVRVPLLGHRMVAAGGGRTARRSTPGTADGLSRPLSAVDSVHHLNHAVRVAR